MSRYIDVLSTYGLFFGIPVLFLAVVFWVYRPGAARRYRDDGELPFGEPEEAEPPHR